MNCRKQILDRRTFLGVGGLAICTAPRFSTVCWAEADSAATKSDSQPQPPQFSGIYPHLAFFNNENECGTGALVPWAERLWVVTYAPHAPRGSSDKLYEIAEDLTSTIRPESIGGTPANRMIHRESNQLFIGPYVIDADRQVRVIPYTRMFGRPTGNAWHLTDPESKVYCASMEEALYEIDVRTLEVVTLYFDEAVGNRQPKSDLPGYHGKGLYSGQGRLIYANNGEHGEEALRNPFVPSGVLAEWDGRQWRHIARAQFTEVTGPGGICGNANPQSDPVWSIGWDAKSLILMLLDNGVWHRFRLPKASHTYDGAHGWNTEWPRIRDVGEDDLLMTMHGMFWRFPKAFSAANSAGVAPRSTYLKVIGDFCRWQGRIVCGCDDAARDQFVNDRKAKGNIAPPQSQSNLWFVRPDQIDGIGPPIGRGAVWLDEDVQANTPSDPFLFDGFQGCGLHLAHDTESTATVSIEVDRAGDGNWTTLANVSLAPRDYVWRHFDDDDSGVWLRLRSDQPLAAATAWFSYGADSRPVSTAPPSKFAGVAQLDDASITGGVIRSRAENKRTLHFAAMAADDDGRTSEVGLYELDGDMVLRRVDDPQQHQWLKQNAAIPNRRDFLVADEASMIYVDDAGRRFRIPRTDPAYDAPGPLGWERFDREVVTERDLFHCHGTFFELPGDNAGGFSRIRPVSTHRMRVFDYCSYRGLLVCSGVNLAAAGDNPHIIRSEDGMTGLWVGALDDLWQLGKPVGYGGPWKDTAVEANQPSDPYLMTGYDRKTLTLWQGSTKPRAVSVEIDVTGTGVWHRCRSFEVDPASAVNYEFPRSFHAYWIRFIAADAATVTAQLRYE